MTNIDQSKNVKEHVENLTFENVRIRNHSNINKIR